MLVLGLPIVYSLMIAAGIMIVIVGSFFHGGSAIRTDASRRNTWINSATEKNSWHPLPSNKSGFWFRFGCVCDICRPAIGVLRAAGAGVDPTAAPLVWTILNTGAGLLVNCVGVGVGIAVLLGVLRFYKGWSLSPSSMPGRYLSPNSLHAISDDDLSMCSGWHGIAVLLPRVRSRFLWFWHLELVCAELCRLVVLVILVLAW